MSELGFGGKRELEDPEFMAEFRRSSTGLNDRSVNDDERLSGFRDQTLTSADLRNSSLPNQASSVPGSSLQDILEASRDDLRELSQVEFADCLSVSIPRVDNTDSLYALQTIRPEFRADFIDSPAEALWVRLEEHDPKIDQALLDIASNHKRLMDLSANRSLFIERSDGGQTYMRVSDTNGWYHFQYNKDEFWRSRTEQLGMTTPKLYVTVSQPEENFNLELVRKVGTALADAGINCRLKVPRSSAQVIYCFDNIVVHTESVEDLQIAKAAISRTLTGLDHTITCAADADGKSFSELLVGSIKAVQDGTAAQLEIHPGVARTLEKLG